MSHAGTVDPQTALQRFWGYDAFRPLQEEAVSAALSGRDALVIMPTGGGKSLCYQVPAACADGLVLVISPLIALMDDQVSAAVVAGLRAGALHSNCPAAKRRQTYAAAANGDLDLLYVSPERFVLGDLLESCADRIALIAVDEAHCVSHWGHDFRPEYRQLAPWFERLPQVPRMALTATATPQVQHDIRQQLGLREPLILIGHPDRPNLIYRAVPRHNAITQVLQILSRHQGEGGIIYCQTRKETERIAEALVERGLDAAPYHAGLPAARRTAVQDAFVRERLDVVVATIAFGMGIDRSNVRYVIHANMPRSIEHYQQESGRAGRDGQPAECVLLASAGDLVTHRRLAELDGPLPPERKAALERQLAEIGRYAISPVCRHLLLSQHFGHDLDISAEGGCGACDVCRGETEALDQEQVEDLARKIISAVWRLEGRFGVNHVIDVLRGSKSQKVLRFRHHDLSVYGLLQDYPEASLRSWIDQLIVQGLLEVVDQDRMPLLAMTNQGRDYCKTCQPQIRLSRFTAPARKRDNRARRMAQDAGLDGEGVELFERLRRLRRLLAEAQDIAPYMVFSDASLRDMALLRPRSDDDFLLVHGVGEHKRIRYARSFLAVIAGVEPDAAATMCG